MGNRTLSVMLVLRALFLDDDAYAALRDDDNPFIEGLFLIVILSAATAAFNLIGQLLAWASMPRMAAIRDTILDMYQAAPWWPQIAGNPEARQMFDLFWGLGWRVFPAMFGAPDPGGAAINIITWPLFALVSWLVYGVLAYLFARWLKGSGTLNQTLGTTALAFSPLLFRGLGFIPFFTLGGVLGTWQLICRYKAVRNVHALPWQRAFWATVLPFGVYFLFWLLMGGLGMAIIASIVGR